MDSRYASKKTTFTVLTVPRALSRIHRNGKSIWLIKRMLEAEPDHQMRTGVIAAQSAKCSYHCAGGE
ncbi:TPA: hypothetical protein J1706_003979 [Escherichia coli]|uniref:Uncharacterized protein n=1 Tax=Escherichia marmotae TaxID=1499973 RepID=A0A7W3AN92_9ESCH|nr:hypothetical protein [Escherichia marmotae]MBA7900559.1 hypothetical protein [Escherichia marmotae]QLW52997.1 hypothetical protein HV246_24285 [Escherichia marmotae]HAZ4602777.1 hypothetical protein [Escherichia coli]